MSDVLSRVPNLMMLDDHEVFNSFGYTLQEKNKSSF